MSKIKAIKSQPFRPQPMLAGKEAQIKLGPRADAIIKKLEKKLEALHDLYLTAAELEEPDICSSVVTRINQIHEAINTISYRIKDKTTNNIEYLKHVIKKENEVCGKSNSYECTDKELKE